MSTTGPWWVDGVLVARSGAALRADDSANSVGPGCFTTARISNGRPRFAARHARRLRRDAAGLGLPAVECDFVLRALVETGRAAFGDRDGVVRVQASRDSAGGLQLTAVPRALGPERASWRARRAPFAHEGPMPWSGAKVSNHLLYALAAQSARDAGLDEAILLDRAGYLVEGSRSNILVVDEAGRVSLPDLARGGVAGVAREVLCERAPEIEIRHVPETEMATASELIAINAVRGARPIVSLDGCTVGDGEPGPVARRLDTLLARDDPAGWSPCQGA